VRSSFLDVSWLIITNVYSDRSEDSFSKIRIEALSNLQIIMNEKDFTDINDFKFTDMVIMDDLMYLHSMRRDVYKLTRDHRIPQIVVHVETDLETALARNAARSVSEHIPADVVTRLCLQMEAPNTTAIADRYNCTVSGQTVERYSQICY
jgi:tRNA uridine 5-carbamoylmethylation protein Kti12